MCWLINLMTKGNHNMAETRNSTKEKTTKLWPRGNSNPEGYENGALGLRPVWAAIALCEGNAAQAHDSSTTTLPFHQTPAQKVQGCVLWDNWLDLFEKMSMWEGFNRFPNHTFFRCSYGQNTGSARGMTVLLVMAWLCCQAWPPTPESCSTALCEPEVVSFSTCNLESLFCFNWQKIKLPVMKNVQIIPHPYVFCTVLIHTVFSASLVFPQ